MTEYNAADRKSIRAAEKAFAIAERERGEVVVEMMATQARRRYIWDKLGEAHIFSTSFSTDPTQMAFNEGQRNQGLVLLNDIIQYCPEQFIEAMREANGRRTSSDAARSPAPGERASSEGRDGDDSGPGSEADSGESDTRAA
jgi:hypothetical protein